MRLTVIGTGYVGLVSGICFSKLGIKVTCVDIDEKKINKLKKGIVPIYEPGLEDLLKDNNHITFTTNLKEAMQVADVIMIAVGTPENKSCPHNSADLSYVYKCTKNIAKHLKPYQIVLTKSTVPVGTGSEIKKIISSERPDLKLGEDYDVASNPEFLREGSAINDFMKPDRIVIGVKGSRSKSVLEKLYLPLSKKEDKIFFTDINSAELIKYASNAFLATKIAFINQISDLCEQVDADVDDVAFGMGLDKRISPEFLRPGPGYGGSCFPKDTKAILHTAEKSKTELSIVKSVIGANNKRKKNLAKRILKFIKSNPEIKKIAVLGITFKANTDDMRDASSLTILPELISNGIEVNIYDPIYHLESEKTNTMHEFRKAKWSKSIEDAINGADGVCILTEWNEFREIDWNMFLDKFHTKKPLLVDYRNMYKKDSIPCEYNYLSLGRKDRL